MSSSCACIGGGDVTAESEVKFVYPALVKLGFNPQTNLTVKHHKREIFIINNYQLTSTIIYYIYS